MCTQLGHEAPASAACVEELKNKGGDITFDDLEEPTSDPYGFDEDEYDEPTFENIDDLDI